MRGTERIEPVVRRVRVPAEPSAAFRRFTAELGSWWPLATHSVGQAAAETVRMGEGVGGSIVERTRDGGEHVWGTVRVWEPPARLAFSWHPGRPPAGAQEVEVTFAAVAGGGTEVTLVHGGWEWYGEGASEARAPYVEGWARVLALYGAG